MAVVTVSDRARRGERADATGPALARDVALAGHCVATRRVVADDPAALVALIRDLAGSHDVVLLAGGTGIAPRDRTPEAVQGACELLVPGIGEAIRAHSRERVPTSVLSRACAGVLDGALVVALPGSPGGAVDGWNAIRGIVAHAVSQVGGGDHPA